jgi:hypothetical protein
MDKGVPKCIFPRYTDSVVLRATHDLAGGRGVWEPVPTQGSLYNDGDLERGAGPKEFYRAQSRKMNDGSDGYRTHSSRPSSQKAVFIAVGQAERKIEESMRI